MNDDHQDLFEKLGEQFKNENLKDFLNKSSKERQTQLEFSRAFQRLEENHSEEVEIRLDLRYKKNAKYVDQCMLLYEFLHERGNYKGSRNAWIRETFLIGMMMQLQKAEGIVLAAEMFATQQKHLREHGCLEDQVMEYRKHLESIRDGSNEMKDVIGNGTEPEFQRDDEPDDDDV